MFVTSEREERVSGSAGTHWSLRLGLALGGLITGFMVGASASPIAGAAVTAIFSALVAMVAVIFNSPLDSAIADLAGEKGLENRKELNVARARRAKILSALGKLLLLFLVLFAVGLFLGAKARIQGWFDALRTAPKELVELAAAAPTRDEAIYRIELFESLVTHGFNPSNASAIAAKTPESALATTQGNSANPSEKAPFESKPLLTPRSNPPITAPLPVFEPRINSPKTGYPLPPAPHPLQTPRD